MSAEKPPQARGFTLIEIMLAMLVMTVGIVAMTGLLGTALDTSATARDDLHAVSFADMVFNYYHAADWNDVPPDGSWIVPDYDGGTLTLNASGRFDGIVSGTETYTLSYRFDARMVEGRKALTLQVWPGRGTTGSPRIFQTELYNWEKQ
jgi:prepilin-type N-terminal cleavage/methylation domain-containing protein